MISIVLPQTEGRQGISPTPLSTIDQQGITTSPQMIPVSDFDYISYGQDHFWFACCPK